MRPICPRFLFLNYGVVFTDVGMAWRFSRCASCEKWLMTTSCHCRHFLNGSPRAGRGGALIWDKGGEFKDTGHVAIITQLHGNKVRIAEQNVIHSRCRKGNSGRASWRWWSKTAAIP
ncbi:CHAP domain-containing protein [Escherichia coli]